MTDNKNDYITDEIKINKQDIYTLVSKKIDFFYDIIQKTIIHIQKIKTLDILGITDVNNCNEKLNDINFKIKNLSQNIKNPNNTEQMINDLQIINNDLSCILKNYGTDSLEDLLLICFGTNNKLCMNSLEENKLELLKKYFHPTSYKVINKKEETKLKKNEDNSLQDKMNNIDCSDLSLIVKQFHLKVYGIKLYINNTHLKKKLIIYGILDDIVIEYLHNNYILLKQTEQFEFTEKTKNDTTYNQKEYEQYIKTLTLKDYLIVNSGSEFYNKFIGLTSKINSIKQKPISNVVKEFITDDLYTKRNTLINLLISVENNENNYLAYLLYDLLSNDTNGNVDTQEQTILYDSFPWIIKQHFKNAMKKTIEYTNELTNFDVNKIPLEQQICLLKAPNTVKEKAMMKLKEIKSKSEDSGSKARQYLDGLLKIPFSIYKKEPILHIMNDTKKQFVELCNKYKLDKIFENFTIKTNYTNIEINNYIKQIKNTVEYKEYDIINSKLTKYLLNGDKPKLIENIRLINNVLQKMNLKNKKIKNNNLKKEELKKEIQCFIDECQGNEYFNIIKELYHSFHQYVHDVEIIDFTSLKNEVEKIEQNSLQITNSFKDIQETLNASVYGHNKAKRQIERIIAQWMNGEQNGYVCGFEGPPGVGKTSLAKGLANCLKDENGISRPFALIAIGGDSNSSSLIGHSYTYVGSTWGQILQILMDKKCMNPVILIDEVDKISKTEHGKEIIGILTHLLDPTQNDTFQDKYFSGVDLDLSKVLFILSYNDVHEIDRIMLDRITRIKFDNLSLEDKLIVCNKHLLPEIYKNMGLQNMIHIPDDVLKFIIEEYTLEAGVRKLKEILTEIIGEINLDFLKSQDETILLPISITIQDLKTKYLKDKREQIIRKVFTNSKIGFVNGMYATTLGNGGTLPIHAQFFPSNSFLELKLTGLQQEVMKESMHVALTVAWNLTEQIIQTTLREKYDDKYKCGINIHPGDGSVQKDGPSAGCAITCAIYSLLNNIPIKSEFGITGEIQMSGEVTAIGGLSYKILGSIKSGVKHFIYPKENKKDFDDFMKKYKDYEELHDIHFYSIQHVKEALELLLDVEKDYDVKEKSE